MKILRCEQGGPEWRAARAGLPTASCNDKILQPVKLGRSASAKDYRSLLLTEWLIGEPIETGASDFMERGKELEAEARARYEWDRNVEVETVGLILRDDRQYGASPDGLIGDVGGLEIKTPALVTHVGYMADPASLVDEYRGQVQGNLYVSGRSWWDVMSYSPMLPPVIERVYPDEKYLAALEDTLKWFTAWLREGREILAPHRPASAGRMDATLESLLEQSLATVGHP